MTRRQQRGKAFIRLCDIMDRLRGPGGCPWDAEQTPISLKDYIIEEAYELIEAIDDGNPDQIRDELGDLLLQVVFQAAIFSERGEFDAADVATAIGDKLLRRHPHVFSDAVADDHETLHRQWDAIKRDERRGANLSISVLSGVPQNLPALQRTQKLLDRAARNGFLRDDRVTARIGIDDVLGRIDLLAPDADQAELQLAIGDLLHAVVRLARQFGASAEESLRQSNRQFSARFHSAEVTLASLGKTAEKLPDGELTEIWNRAKNDSSEKKSAK